MARPAGHKLSAIAWEDLLVITGRSLTDISRISGVPRATISSLLGGHHGASVPVAQSIARAVGVRSATLFPSLLLEDDAPVEAEPAPARKRTPAQKRRPRWIATVSVKDGRAPGGDHPGAPSGHGTSRGSRG